MPFVDVRVLVPARNVVWSSSGEPKVTRLAQNQ